MGFGGGVEVSAPMADCRYGEASEFLSGVGEYAAKHAAVPGFRWRPEDLEVSGNGLYHGVRTFSGPAFYLGIYGGVRPSKNWYGPRALFTIERQAFEGSCLPGFVGVTTEEILVKLGLATGRVSL